MKVQDDLKIHGSFLFLIFLFFGFLDLTEISDSADSMRTHFLGAGPPHLAQIRSLRFEMNCRLRMIRTLHLQLHMAVRHCISTWPSRSRTSGGPTTGLQLPMAPGIYVYPLTICVSAFAEACASREQKHECNAIDAINRPAGVVSTPIRGFVRVSTQRWWVLPHGRRISPADATEPLGGQLQGCTRRPLREFLCSP